MASRSLIELVAAHLEGWDLTSTDEAVFGTKDPGTIVSLLDRFCQEQLGSGVAGGLFYGSSVGCVAGVELGDGRKVVVKAYQRRWTREFLAAVARVQRHLAGRGFPCPEALVGGQSLGPALANVEVFLPDPGARILALPADMAAIASGLAWQIGLARDLSEPPLDNHPLNAGSGELSGAAQSVFRFLRPGPSRRHGSTASAPRPEPSTTPTASAVTIANTDWSARNIRVHSGELRAAYDWDSLSRVPEAVAVGQAAATWCSLGEPGDPVAPSPEQTMAYVSAYERAAAHRLTPEQRKIAQAAALWVLCYTARCEHAIEATTGRTIDRARARLASDGHRYLQ